MGAADEESERAGADDPRDRRAQGEGATVGEAKWSAMKRLERRFPGATADCVSFTVTADGDPAADSPAQVDAELDLDAWREVAATIPEEPAERVRALVERVTLALDLRASVDVEETPETIRATVNGDDVALLIGRHGATIDALQHLAARAAFHGGNEERKAVIVDAAGYRERREAALRRAADRAVEDALSFGRRVELEPMGSQERKVVHLYLRDRTDVETHSEGDEPERRLVVTPVRADLAP